MTSSLSHTHLLYEALSYIHYPSIRYCGKDKGKDPTGFDCSGFIIYLLHELEIPVPPHIRHCNEIFDEFGILIHPEYATPGDLIFLSRDGTRPTHIGIMLNKYKYIHAPGSNNSKVCIDDIPTFTPKPHSHAIYSHNPIGYKRISISISTERWKKLL